MPPNSKTIFDEGASVETFKIVREGVFDESGLIRLLVDEPTIGTRTLRDNISDIQAQIAATYKGVTLVQELVQQYGLATVQRYMYAIQDTADNAVRNLLKTFSRRFNGEVLEAIDYMDDGTPIALKVHIDPDTGGAVFDFTGTGPEVYGRSRQPSCGLTGRLTVFTQFL
jgi:5-oxoprolinase (ATP-hydrolysing)